MNQRYKTLKRARQLNDPLLCDDYKRLRNKVSTTTKKAKADYYFNLFDEANSAAAYWRLLKKTSGTTKVNRQAHQLKKDDGTLTTDDTEKATMLNDYFCTVAIQFNSIQFFIHTIQDIYKSVHSRKIK